MADRNYTNEELARMLAKVYETKETIEPLTELEPSLTIEDAYEIQFHQVKKLLEKGEVVSGKKIGLTSPGMQKLLGVNEPDYGHLFQVMDIRSEVLDTGCLIQPKIEGEIAFVLKEDLAGPDVTVDDVLRATDYVVPALEIVDSRVRDWKIKLIDTVSDNASSGCYVLGSQQTKLEGVNLKEIQMTLYKNGEVVNQGVGADVLGDPAYAVAWLANKMLGFGVTLKKGDVILSGAFSAAPPVKKGDEFEAVFDTLGSVKVKFS